MWGALRGGEKPLIKCTVTYPIACRPLKSSGTCDGALGPCLAAPAPGEAGSPGDTGRGAPWSPTTAPAAAPPRGAPASARLLGWEPPPRPPLGRRPPPPEGRPQTGFPGRVLRQQLPQQAALQVRAAQLCDAHAEPPSL